MRSGWGEKKLILFVVVEWLEHLEAASTTFDDSAKNKSR